MQARIETLTEKKCIGKRLTMSLVNNKTRELWQSFMPVRHEIRNSVGADLYSIQLYNPLYFTNFNPASPFEKWAALEVTDFMVIPEGMEPLVIPGGLYAVFLHIGAASTGPATFQYIFGTWLPNSPYSLDERPHFEILGKKYKNDDSSSEEEIWIPVRFINSEQAQ